MTRPLDGYPAHRRDRGRGPQRVLHVMTARRLYLARVKEEASFEQILDRYSVKTRGAGAKRMALLSLPPGHEAILLDPSRAQGLLLLRLWRQGLRARLRRPDRECIDPRGGRTYRRDVSDTARRSGAAETEANAKRPRREIPIGHCGLCRFGSRSIHRIHIWQEDTSVLNSPQRSASGTAATAPCRVGSASRSTTNAACSSHTPAAGPATSYRKAFRNTICRANFQSVAFFSICTVSPAPSIWSWSRDIGRSSAFTVSAYRPSLSWGERSPLNRRHFL